MSEDDDFKGDASRYPTQVTLPDCSSVPTCDGTVNPALRALGDRTEFLRRRHGGAARELVVVEFTEPGSHTWTVPPNVTWILVEACGGGGAGGAGGQPVPEPPAPNNNRYASGGGGGGAAALGDAMFVVLPGETLNVDVGAGGIGGAGDGNPGSPSHINDVTGTRRLIFPGASGGRAGSFVTSSLADFLAPGGGQADALRQSFSSTTHSGLVMQLLAHDGGWARSSTNDETALGGSSPCAGMGPIPVSAPGARGVDSASYRGAGGGGGGATSAFGRGGNGGAGGNGNGSGHAGPGAVGSNAVGPGAGGGGGGGGGNGSLGPGVPGRGGNGATGLVRISYVNPALELPVKRS